MVPFIVSFRLMSVAHRLFLLGFPYLECEIMYICKHEMVCTLSDMLTIRMRVAYLNKDAAIAAAPRVADLMAKQLGWSWREKNRQLQHTLDVLATFGGPIPNRAAAELELFQEVKSVREVFEKMDLGNTGYVDLTEFKDCCTMLGMPFKNHREAKRAFNYIDRNHAGKIDEAEFVAWWKKGDRLQGQIASKLRFRATKERAAGAAFG
jgi:glycerol-3-phosphate dehydrogenase